MNLYGRLEQEVINDIARRVAKTGRYTETAEIQARALREQGFSPAKIQSEVMKSLNADNAYLNEVAINTKEYKAKVVELIEETVAQAIIDGDALIAEAGLMSFNDDLQIWQEHGADLTKDNTLDQLNKAFTKQTMGELENLTRSTGALDVGGVPILNAYRHEMDLATVKVASGAFSFQQAMEDCCHRLGKNGVAVTYPSGRKYSLESATRMCLKTGLSQLSGKITEANMDKTSTSLVYVSAHAGARPEHAEWQGKVYTYDGKPSRKYPDFVESTGYGTVTGLKGVNCSHEFYPWWEGDEIPEFHEPDPVEIDGRTYTYYEATQKQRQMERSVRNMSREQQAALAAGDNQKATELNAKIKATKQDYKAFSQAAGLRAKTERMKVYDGSTPPGSKAVKITPPVRKMATIHGTEWPAPGKPMTREEYKSLKQYAKSKGVTLTNTIQEFDGKPETIRNIIDDIESVVKDNEILRNTKRNISLSLADMIDDNDYAMTSGLQITINKNAYRDTNILEMDYQKSVKDKWFMEGTTHRSIIMHEMGHIYANQKGDEKIIKTIMKEYKIENKSKLSEFAEKNLSTYAGKGQSGHEIIGEVFAGVYGSKKKNPVALQIKALCDKI